MVKEPIFAKTCLFAGPEWSAPTILPAFCWITKRAINGLKSSLKIAIIFGLCTAVIFTFFNHYIVSWFINGEVTLKVASWAIVTTSYFYWALGTIHIMRGFLNGSGDTGYALVNGIAEVICRIGLSLVLTHIAAVSFYGIWITTCCTWFVTAAVSVIRYSGGRWKNKSLVSH